MGLESIFVLTTRTMHWFIKRGFVQVDADWLPEARKRKYNWDRRSQVFVKKLGLSRYRQQTAQSRSETDMARTVQCVYLKKRSRRPGFRALPGRTRQAHLRLGQQGSLGGVDEAPDDAGQRKPPQSRRPARPPIPGAADGEFLLRCRRRAAGRICSADRLNIPRESSTVLVNRKFAKESTWQQQSGNGHGNVHCFVICFVHFDDGCLGSLRIATRKRLKAHCK